MRGVVQLKSNQSLKFTYLICSWKFTYLICSAVLVLLQRCQNFSAAGVCIRWSDRHHLANARWSRWLSWINAHRTLETDSWSKVEIARLYWSYQWVMLLIWEMKPTQDGTKHVFVLQVKCHRSGPGTRIAIVNSNAVFHQLFKTRPILVWIVRVLQHQIGVEAWPLEQLLQGWRTVW